MKKDVVKQYLEQMDRQREEIFCRLESVDPDLIWKRPAPKKWSVGEQLDHTRAIVRFVRRFIALLWPLVWLVGWLRRHRPFVIEIDDVYERPGFPLNVGWLWPPKYTPEKPASLNELKRALEEEHQKVRAFYGTKPVNVLGNAPLYDPAIGWLNMIQVLRVGLHHDAHHHKVVEGILVKFGEPLPEPEKKCQTD